MRKLLLLVLCYFAFQQLDAQQLPLFNQYREYPGFVNPAAVNMDNFVFDPELNFFFKGGLGSRLQWVGNKDFTIHTSIINTEFFFHPSPSGISFGGGLFAMQDKVDVTSMNGLYGKGALYVGAPDNRFWGGLGFNVGYVHHTINIQKLKAYHANDPLLLNYAPLSSASPDLGVGAFGVLQWGGYETALSFGFSIPQIMETEVRFEDGNLYDYNLLRHVFTHVTFFTATSSENFGFFEASAWGKWVEGLGNHIDLNLRYQVDSNFWFGAGGSSSGALHLEIGTNFRLLGIESEQSDKRSFLRLGYGFDVPFNPKYASYLGASHELHCALIIY